MLSSNLTPGDAPQALPQCLAGSLLDPQPVSYTHLTLPTNREV